MAIAPLDLLSQKEVQDVAEVGKFIDTLLHEQNAGDPTRLEFEIHVGSKSDRVMNEITRLYSAQGWTVDLSTPFLIHLKM
jgi:hypothetical protein